MADAPPWLTPYEVTDEQLLRQAKVALATVLSMGQATTTRGAAVQRAQVRELKELIAELETKIASLKGPAINKVRMRRR